MPKRKDPPGTVRCAVCGRVLGPNPHHEARVGYVGSECRQKVAGMNDLLDRLNGLTLSRLDPQERLRATDTLIRVLRRIGFEVRVDRDGDTSVVHVGGSQRKAKLLVQSFEERRAEFAEQLFKASLLAS